MIVFAIAVAMKGMAASLCLLALLCVLVAGKWQDGNDGVDRSGGDLPESPYTLNTTAVPEDCASMCWVREQCVAWSYGKPACDNIHQIVPLCWLKSNVPPQSLNKCRVRHTISFVCTSPPIGTPIPVSSCAAAGIWCVCCFTGTSKVH